MSKETYYDLILNTGVIIEDVNQKYGNHLSTQ